MRAPGYDDPAALDVAARLVDQHGPRLAAVVLEPLVQGAAGMLVADPAAYGPLVAACRRHDVLLICDEVATGFGRTGTLFASEQCGLRPDLMTIGKGLTGGYLPMSATVASDRVHRAFLGPDLSAKTLYHGHSYSGNALAAAVALRHLELYDEWDVLADGAGPGGDAGSPGGGTSGAAGPGRRRATVRPHGGRRAGAAGRRAALGSPGVRRRGAAGGAAAAARRRGRPHAPADRHRRRGRAHRRHAGRRHRGGGRAAIGGEAG